jgi:hypothetical protein
MLTKPDEAAERSFLAIFSLSQNFDCVLEALERIYNSRLLNASSDSETQLEFVYSCFTWLFVAAHGFGLSILNLVTKFVSHLWLTDRQISRVSQAFGRKPNLVRSVARAMSILNEGLQKLEQDNMAAIPDPIFSLDNASLGVLAEELAEALAVLEDDVRRTDPVGECVRWSAQRFTRDFLSFPERVSSFSRSSLR